MPHCNFQNTYVRRNLLSILFYFLLLISGCKDNPVNGGNPPIGVPPVYPSIDGFPAWSPDGTHIIYNHYGITSIDVGGSYNIDRDSSGLWLINANGTDAHIILKGDDINADWSPDGNWIVFEVNAQIYKAPFHESSIDTSQIVQLTYEGRNFFPNWSPDGQSIAFDSNNESPNGMNFIWIMNVDGSQKRRIAYEPTEGEIRMPYWSPIGNEIVHQRYIGTGAPEIFVMDTSGNNPIRLTFDNNFDNYPKYSPDGANIVFESNSNIWTMNAEGTNKKQITSSGGMQPDWSPDGLHIVYVGWTEKKYDPLHNGTLYILKADGSNKSQLSYGIPFN